MNNLDRKFSIDVKDILLIALILFGAYQFLLKPEREVVTEKETITIDIKKVVEEAINNNLQLQQPVQQPTIIYKDRVVPAYKDTTLTKQWRSIKYAGVLRCFSRKASNYWGSVKVKVQILIHRLQMPQLLWFSIYSYR